MAEVAQAIEQKDGRHSSTLVFSGLGRSESSSCWDRTRTMHMYWSRDVQRFSRSWRAQRSAKAFEAAAAGLRHHP